MDGFPIKLTSEIGVFYFVEFVTLPETNIAPENGFLED